MKAKVPLRIAMIAAAMASALFGAATPACACSCVKLTDEEYFAAADAVFTATAVRQDDPVSDGGTASSGDQVVHVFEVHSVLKGDVARQQGVTSERSSATCGLAPVTGQDYLVFATRAQDRLTAGLCGGTRPVAVQSGVTSDSAVASATPTPPREGSLGVPPHRNSMPGWTLAGGGVLLVAGAGALVVVLRRRRRTNS